MSNVVTVKWIPALVDVSDDRGSVQGAKVEVSGPESKQVGLAIPREGDCPEAWLGDLGSQIVREYPEHYRDVLDSLRIAACSGAVGESGMTTVSID